MPFVWDSQNTAHMAEHGLTPETAEAVFLAPDAVFCPSSTGQGRIECEGTVAGRLHRLVFSRIEGTEDLYPISCFPIRKRRVP